MKAGAFDSLNKNRAQTFGAVEALTRHSQATHESRGSNQNSLFGDDTAQRRPQLPKMPDWAPMERLQNEFSAIGFYLSSHPLASYERSLQRLGVSRAADLPALLAQGVDPVWLAMLITVNLQSSFLTPPFGWALFYLKGVAPPEITIKHIYKLLIVVLWVMPMIMWVLSVIVFELVQLILHNKQP